ncbi:MAG: TM2 domain-containing protein [Chloroflexota bacterium]
MGELPQWGRAHIRMMLSWCIGYLGADRFYDGQIGLGILKLVTCGGLLVWWLIDAITYTAEAGGKRIT